MQLLHLSLQNFRQHERTELSLGPGLLAVVGPNGSGKSTLLEAIAWALYGNPAARGTRETIKRRGSPPRARVEVSLAFILGNHTYHLTRTLTNAELSMDGAVIANGGTAVSERIRTLLGMQRDEFFNTYFTGQKELAVMASMTPGERGRFLSRVLGYEKLRAMQEVLRARRSERRAELSGIEQGLGDPEELDGEISRAQASLEAARAEQEAAHQRATAAAEAAAALEPEWNAASERRTAWQGLDGERRVAEAKVVAARSALEALDRQLAAALDAKGRLESLAESLVEWPTLVVERNELDRAATLVTARSKAVARKDQVEARRADITRELSTLASDEVIQERTTARASAQAAVVAADERLNERRTRWKQDEQEARTKLDFYRDRYKELREQRRAIEAAGPNGICPFCQRPLGDDVTHTFELLDAQMEETEASGNYYRQRVEQLKSTPEEVSRLEEERRSAVAALQSATEALAAAEGDRVRRTRLQAELARLERELEQLNVELAGPAASYDAARHEAVRSRIAELEPLRSQFDQLSGLAARAETLAADAASAEQAATAAELALEEIIRRIEALQWDPEQFAGIDARLTAARNEVQQAEIVLTRAAATVTAAEQVHAAALARRADRAAKAEVAFQLARELDRWNELDRAIGELRTELNQQLRPDLRERAARFLGDLTRGRYDDLELDEDYVATVVEDGEVKPVISGGEEDVLHLSLRLAISEMIAERAGQPLSLLVLDEVFGSLDEERRLAVVELLRAIADRFPQVILISHIESLRDAFDRVVRVEYDVERGVSTVHDDTRELVDVAE